MKTTQYLLATLKTELPKNCESISYQLMLKSGMIRKVSSGLYIWLPTGLRVLKKIKNIIRNEMNSLNFIEIFMPITQPSNLWKQSGRWSEYGPELLRFKNRLGQNFVLGPTHEEIVSDLICKEITSYKQFPIKIYQINTKYRDEARSQSGIIRSKEFIMKDGYSFHLNQQSLQNTYDDIYQKYCAIFNRIGLNFTIVEANPGNIGGTLSHEFQAYFKNTNKIITPLNTHNNLSNHIQVKNYSSSRIFKNIQLPLPKEKMRLIDISKKYEFIQKESKQIKLSIKKSIKIIIVRTKNLKQNNPYNFLGLIIRADHQLNYAKLLQIPDIYTPISILNPKTIEQIIKTQATLINFINLSIPLIVDCRAALMSDFIIESGTQNQYFFGVNWNRDLSMPKIADLCQIPYKKNNNSIPISTTIEKRNMEIAHIFQLSNKYSNSIYSCIQKSNKYNLSVTMGCYGIGVTRIIPMIIEQNYDNSGIIWPNSIAPFKLAIIPININHSINVQNISEKLYNQFLSIIGSDVLMDDRKENMGKIFNDIDLIGIPHILIVSDRNLHNQEIEYKNRRTGITKKIKLDIIVQFLSKKLI